MKVIKKISRFQDNYTILANAPYKIKKQIHHLPDHIYTELGSQNDHIIMIWDDHKLKFSNNYERIVFYYRDKNDVNKLYDKINQNINENELQFLINIWINRINSIDDKFTMEEIEKLINGFHIKRGTIEYYIDNKIDIVLMGLIAKIDYVKQHKELEKELIPILKLVLKHYGNKEINPVYESYNFLISFIKDIIIDKSKYDELYNVLNFINTYINNYRYKFENKNNDSVEEV